MTISSIRLYRQWQPFRDGTYRCSGGRSAEGFEFHHRPDKIAATARRAMVRWRRWAASTIRPLPKARGRRCASWRRELDRRRAPAVEALNRRMDLLLKGHPYAKAAIDMALWDLAGKRAGLPHGEISPAARGTTIPLYRSLAQEAPDAMAKRAQKYIVGGLSPFAGEGRARSQ